MSFYGKAKGFEVETYAFLKIQPGVIVKSNARRVHIVRGPPVRLTQQWPYLRSGQTGHNNFVRDKTFGRS